MRPLSGRIFSRRRRSSSSSSFSATSSESRSVFSEAISSSSESSRSGSSLGIHAILIDLKDACTSSRPRRARAPDSGSEADAIRIASPVETITNPHTPAPHECQCKSRSTCPEFLRQHVSYMQTHEWRCLPEDIFFAYHDEYQDALAVPAAKLARARAEYDWAMNYQAQARLLAPRLLEQLAAARRKVVMAEKDWETACAKRVECARLMMDIGRF